MILPLIAALAAPAAADAPAAMRRPEIACRGSSDKPRARELRAWTSAHPLADGFAIGRAVDVPTVSVEVVRLAVQPSRPLTGTHLASASFDVKRPGMYRVAVGGSQAPIRPIWLDVAGADYRPLASTGHGHGPRCTSITKVVDFELARGRYTVLATGLTSDAPVRVLVLRKR